MANNRNPLTRARRAEKFKPTHWDNLAGGREVQVVQGNGYFRVIRRDGYEERMDADTFKERCRPLTVDNSPICGNGRCRLQSTPEGVATCPAREGECEYRG
jgi:hypothetical protein